ncbi:MAG: NAD(P)H-hydrate dehydratase [Dehalococcoidia bacterium]|nr:NAD(P)H-hydrate dehydratase [Dehalococcoidia bacterium]
MKLVTSAEMRQLEQAAVDAGATLAQLMEEAGLAVAQEAWMLLGTLEGRRIVVLVGPGNNGGDGIVAARHLSDWGAEVALVVPRRRRDESLIDGLAPREITIIRGEDDPAFERAAAAIEGCDLVIDALLGIGQKRPIDPGEPLALALQRLRAAKERYAPPKIVAVDLPTGLDADTGAADPLTVEPELTVTFGLPKVGMYQAPGSSLVGRVQVIDIGIPRAAQEAVQLELLTARWAKTALPTRPDDANKGTFGKVLVVGGSSRYIGAPRLSATAAYRAGAGLVTIACPGPLVPMLAMGIAEATWLPQEAAEDGGLRGESAIALRSEWPKFETAVVGPGLGLTDETRALTWALLPDLADLPRGAVLDADALNALAAMDDAAERVPANVVLTPHPGEMARLLGTTVADVQARRIEVTREVAARLGCVVVLKGAHTVVCAPDGRTGLSPYANPLLASAGTGDVLAGMIGAYLSQGCAPFEAACLGVYLHAATGEALRQDYGESGLLAGELCDRLPVVVKEVKS